MTKNELTLESMGNIIAYKLGKVGLELIRYPEASIGDEIDRGWFCLDYSMSQDLKYCMKKSADWGGNASPLKVNQLKQKKYFGNLQDCKY